MLFVPNKSFYVLFEMVAFDRISFHMVFFNNMRDKQ